MEGRPGILLQRGDPHSVSAALEAADQDPGQRRWTHSELTPVDHEFGGGRDRARENGNVCAWQGVAVAVEDVHPFTRSPVHQRRATAEKSCAAPNLAREAAHSTASVADSQGWEMGDGMTKVDDRVLRDGPKGFIPPPSTTCLCCSPFLYGRPPKALILPETPSERRLRRKPTSTLKSCAGGGGQEGQF
ncbi:hypothetical protein K402DRAFT_406357 [Aulographum hederae CBS 113979]|uniref:Uncharacterized protein n=1 Tax=Aulographum hederae CBS 113979 TaxID=1176131 RepID=A0A6G1GT62_9PEZI|nr:hypothetical protein K402DRAFT_406357 [Aulographum hederae CBS 113979]